MIPPLRAVSGHPLVRRTTTADAAAVRDVLCSAFHDDPVFEWLVPDGARRRATLPAFFTPFVAAFQHHDETYAAEDGDAGTAAVALWLPPVPGPDADEGSGLFERAVLGALDPQDHGRMFELMERVQEHHPRVPCFYLNFLGVRPGHQGRGLGSRLLGAVLARCDDEGHAAYLEATTERNRQLYERHGFELVSLVELPDGPTMWAMWREPA